MCNCRASEEVIFLELLDFNNAEELNTNQAQELFVKRTRSTVPATKAKLTLYPYSAEETWRKQDMEEATRYE